MFPMSFMLLLDFTITEGVLVGEICSKYTLTFLIFMITEGVRVGEIWTRCTLVSILTEVLAIGVLVLYLTVYYCIELVFVSLYMGTPAVRSSKALSMAAVGPAYAGPPRSWWHCPGLQSDLPTRGHLGRGGTGTDGA